MHRLLHAFCDSRGVGRLGMAGGQRFVQVLYPVALILELIGSVENGRRQWPTARPRSGADRMIICRASRRVKPRAR